MKWTLNDEQKACAKLVLGIPEFRLFASQIAFVL
jgi:hypothetical protein